jgi:hypothetical protein
MRRNIPRTGHQAMFSQNIPFEHREKKTCRPLTSKLCIISLDVANGVLGGPDFESREEDMQSRRVLHDHYLLPSFNPSFMTTIPLKVSP